MAFEGDPKTRLRDLPKVDDVLRRPELATLELPHWAVVEAVRREISERRRAILDGSFIAADVPSDAVERRARALILPSLRRVINATGVVLHTNLGRAPLAARAVERLGAVAAGYSNLEYELDERSRGSRHDHLAALLVELTGAEAGIVVNNNAAAVLLCLAAVAAGREVIVSRGELIEIGGSFRIPDVMRASGARLVEVGTTNKTHLRDYQAAIGPDTALVMKVHRSNFAIVGFTSEVHASELVALGAPVMIDLGSGTMIDPATFGLEREPTVSDAVKSRAALVTFSGDKLLGGPQAGVIVGSTALVETVRKHPLMRALRPDKLAIAALEATLELYRDEKAKEEVPIVRMLATPLESLHARAAALLAKAGRGSLVEVTSAVGGGALPTASPPSWALALPDPLVADPILRAATPPVVGRIAEDRLILDVRTIFDTELDEVAAAIRTLP